MANFKKFELSPYQKGIIYMIAGVIILLYALGFFKVWLNTFVVAGSILLTVYGFMKVGGIEKIRSLIKRK